MRRFLLAAIRFYQRKISPHKGFCCAYRRYSGGPSCSNLGYRSIRRFGVWRGLALLRQRFDKCSIAHQRLRQNTALCTTPHAPRPSYQQAQAGYCDPSFSYDCGFMACDLISNTSALDAPSHCTHCAACGQYGCAEHCTHCSHCLHCGVCDGSCTSCTNSTACWPWQKEVPEGQWVYLPQKMRG